MKVNRSVEYRERRQLIAGLGFILVVAFLVRLYLAAAFPSIHWPDEIFQYLEQAHRLVFKYGVIPWEYRDGTRSWLVPGFLAGLLKLSDVLNLSQPPAYLFLVAASLSAFSLSVVVIGFLWAYRTQGSIAAIITAALCAVWFELIYFAPKTLVEPIAANILLIAVYLAYPGKSTGNKVRLLAAGLLFGLVVALRVSLAPAIFVAAVYICRRRISDKWIPIFLGALLTFVLSGILDGLTWQYPFQTFASNIWTNVVENRSQMYGTAPWYYYGGKWILIWQGALIPIAVFSVIALRKNLLLGLLAVTIVATHMAVAHKEYRFVFPAVPFIVILTGLGTAEIFGYFQKKLRTKMIMVGAGVIVGWALISGVLAASSQFRQYWFREADNIHAFDFLHNKSDVCGVGLVGVNWWNTAGYTRLHRNVSMIIPQSDVAASFPAYNYALASPQELPVPWPYSKVRCFSDNVCIYHRDGPCENVSDLEVNEVLKRRGQ